MRKKVIATRYPGVYRVPGDDSYRLRGSVKDPKTGRMIALDKMVRASSDREANKLRNDALAECEVASEVQERERLRDYAISWLRLKLPTLKAATRAHYAEVLDNHVLPILGDYYLDAITTADLVSWRDAMRESGARPATINTRMRVLKALMRDATYEKNLPRDPTQRLPALREVRAEDDPNCLSAEDLSRLLAAAAQHAPRWHAFFYTMAFTGTRFGEVTALKWTDVDEVAGVIRVVRAQWKGRVDTTKTGVIRSVPLSPELLAVLQAHRAMLFKGQHPGLAEGWVFPADKGGLMHNTAPRRALAKCLTLSGITSRFTIHGFRRTFNNLMRQVTAGEVVRSMTGHSTVAMTEHYSHVGGEEKRAAIQSLVRLVGATGTSENLGTSLGTRSLSAAQQLSPQSPKYRT